jgi:hypothetical protein
MKHTKFGFKSLNPMIHTPVLVRAGLGLEGLSLTDSFALMPTPTISGGGAGSSGGAASKARVGGPTPWLLLYVCVFVWLG